MGEQTVTSPAKTLREILTEDQELRARLIDVLQPQSHHKLSYEEFLNQIDEDTFAEWVDGEIIMTSPASVQHQNIKGFLESILRVYVEAHNLGVVFADRFQMKLAHTGREPDLLFVAHEHIDRLKSNYLDGPADLVVEIISPESIGRDRGDKFIEYEEAGVPEYWLIDPEREQADFYHRDTRGYYRPILPGTDQIYRSSAVRGFWLAVTWLWHPPQITRALRDLGLV
ncbi:MAG: Uma2 family endonuclease [Chloroflexi bacterium]|nr:Uma2 family endonuclease [Chloroflexota bacterium]